MTPVTVWQRKNEKDVFEHNHIEDGHNETGHPKHMCDDQRKAWVKGKWKATHAFLDENGKVTHNENNLP